MNGNWDWKNVSWRNFWKLYLEAIEFLWVKRDGEHFESRMGGGRAWLLWGNVWLKGWDPGSLLFVECPSRTLDIIQNSLINQNILEHMYCLMPIISVSSLRLGVNKLLKYLKWLNWDLGFTGSEGHCISDKASELYVLDVRCQPELHTLLNLSTLNTHAPTPSNLFQGYLSLEVVLFLSLIFGQCALIRDWFNRGH